MLARLAHWWNQIWFEPASPSPVCVFRILFGLLMVVDGFMRFPDAHMWLSSSGALAVEHAQQGRWSLLLSLHADENTVVGLIVLYIVIGLFLALGWCTRISTIVGWLLLISFSNRIPDYWHSATAVMKTFGFLLIFAPAGAMYSLDSYLKARSSQPPAQLYWPWAQRLMQFLVSATYFKAFFGKLAGETWRNGTAVYYASHHYLWCRLPVPWIFENPLTVKLFTWGTLGIEFALFSLIWIKQCRYWVLLGGIIFHMMINWDFNIDLLEWTVVGAYVLFVRPADLEAAIDKGKAFCTRLISGKQAPALKL